MHTAVLHTATAAPSAARCAADLAWLLQSPPLLSLAPQRYSAQVQAFAPKEAAAIALWLATLDRAHLQRWVAQAVPAKAPMRLGRYAEQLMAYFLQHSGMYELMAANLPLRSNSSNSTCAASHTTLGEFDYLIKDSAGQAWHWELAVKFYVCHAASGVATVHDFKGPAGKDTLALKLGKVFDKQLKHLPPAPYNTINWQPAAYARGWLFYPRDRAQAVCDGLNPQHLSAWWITIDAFMSSDLGTDYVVHLPRLHWLAPYCLDELPVLNRAQMAAHLRTFWLTSDPKRADAAQMVACLVRTDTGWQESSRGFIVPTHKATHFL